MQDDNRPLYLDKKTNLIVKKPFGWRNNWNSTFNIYVVPIDGSNSYEIMRNELKTRLVRCDNGLGKALFE